MKTPTTGRLALLLVLVAAGSLQAHHSLGNFDTTKAFRVKGTVFKVHHINPHSFIYLDHTGADGKMQRWAVEGPPLRNLDRLGIARDFLKVGDVVEACGYLPKEATISADRRARKHLCAEHGGTTAQWRAAGDA